MEGTPTSKIVLLLETPKAREAFLRLARETLPEGAAVVRVTDTVAQRELVLHTSTDPDAALVAREPPLVMPGGRTALVSYLRVSLHRTSLVEHRVRGLRHEMREIATSAVTAPRAPAASPLRRGRA